MPGLDSASASLLLPTHTHIRVGIGMRPRNGAPVPVYYSALGGAFSIEVAPPLGVRTGLSFYPGDFNDWLPNKPSTFDAISADLDFTLSTAKPLGDGMFLPFVGLSNRFTHLSPRDGAQTPRGSFSSSLIAGVRMGSGLNVESRYPLVASGPATDPPAHFETSLGLWWGL